MEMLFHGHVTSPMGKKTLGADFLFRAPKVGGAPKSGKMVKSISSFRFKLMFMVLWESVLQPKAKKSLGAEF